MTMTSLAAERQVEGQTIHKPSVINQLQVVAARLTPSLQYSHSYPRLMSLLLGMSLSSYSSRQLIVYRTESE